MRNIAKPNYEIAEKYELVSDTCLYAVKLMGDEALKTDYCIELNTVASEYANRGAIEAFDKSLALFGSLSSDDQIVALADKTISAFLVDSNNALSNVDEITLATNYQAPLSPNELSVLTTSDPDNITSINANLTDWTEWVDKAKRLAIECNSRITHADIVEDQTTCIRASGYYDDYVLRDVMEEMAETADRLSPDAKRTMMSDEKFKHFYSTYAEAGINMERYYRILGYTPK